MTQEPLTPDNIPRMRDCGLKTLDELVLLVLAESDAQVAKWGLQNHRPCDWTAILAEEFGELAKELLEYHFGGGDGSKIRAEAIQVATLALKIAEMSPLAPGGDQ
jgi:hypothetical protein